MHDQRNVKLKLAVFWSAELSCQMRLIADTATEACRNVAWLYKYL